MFNNNNKYQLEYHQNFFFKSFLISFILLLISTLLCMGMHDFQLAYVHKFFPIDEKDFNYLIILILGIWKILIIQFTLIPALVIFCIRKCGKCGCCKE